MTDYHRRKVWAEVILWALYVVLITAVCTMATDLFIIP